MFFFICLYTSYLFPDAFNYIMCILDDGMRENILYISAGPKVDEKPEAAVYAAVNKKAPESNNNANMYAEVNKGGHLIAEGAMYSDVKPKRGM